MSSMMYLWGGMLLKDLVWMIFILVVSMLLLNLNLVILGSGLNLSVGILMDKLSLMLMMLTFWVCLSIFMIKEVWGILSLKSLLVSISEMLILCFLMGSIFWFYIFFELVLVPMFLLVVLYGDYSERLESGFYMVFYTLVGSLPLLISLVSSLSELSWSFGYSMMSKSELKISVLGSMMMLMAFFVKLPMYGFHIWLPKVHVEAPKVGSSVLAGILLKLGGYGIMRILYFLKLNVNLGSMIMTIGLVGGVNCSLTCLRQDDIKKLVAYSSVVHMGVMMSGALTYTGGAWSGALIMLICHGLCSSGLFYIVSMINERSMTRSMLLIKGCGNLCPSLGLWCYLLTLVNMGCPPFLGFVSESMLCMGILKWSFWLLMILGIVLVISTSYNIYFYSSINHGKGGLVVFKLVVVKDYLLLFLHFYPVVWMIVKMDLFLYL